MTGSEILIELIRQGYIVKLKDDDYIISNKKNREVDQRPVTPEKAFKVDNSPEKLLKQFVADCKIPFRAKGPQGGHYQLTAISDYAKKYFYKVMLEKKYKYKDMVKATSTYYNASDMMRVTLTNYFKHSIFEQIMEEFLKNKQSVHSAPETQVNQGRVSL